MAIEDQDVEDLAKSPLRTQTDEGQVMERPIKELLEADRYVKSGAASAGPPFGMRIARLQPGGTVVRDAG